MTNGRSKQNKAKESPSHSSPSAADGSNTTPTRCSSQRHKGTPQHSTRRGMTTRAKSGARQQVPASAGTTVDARALASTTPPPMGTSTTTLCSSPPTDIPLSINAPSATDPLSPSAPMASSTDILHMVSSTDILPRQWHHLHRRPTMGSISHRRLIHHLHCWPLLPHMPHWHCRPWHLLQHQTIRTRSHPRLRVLTLRLRLRVLKH